MTPAETAFRQQALRAVLDALALVPAPGLAPEEAQRLRAGLGAEYAASSGLSRAQVEQALEAR